MYRDVFLDPAAKEMAARSRTWRRTSERSSCVTVICPDCGRKGLIGGAWTASCAKHVNCELCGYVCVERALDRHLAQQHGIDRPARTAAGLGRAAKK